jgi:hypothetical protein
VNEPVEILQEKIPGFLRWERRKRREQALWRLLFCSLLAALLIAPFSSQLGVLPFRWFIPVFALVTGAPFLFVRTRWRRADSIRALVQLDKRLQLQERVLTAWEVLERDGGCRGAALLVLKEAAERLAGVEPKSLFRRRWGWHTYAVVPLLILWFAVVWLDVSVPSGAATRPAPPRLAHQLEEFSRKLEERAASDRLPDTLRLSRELAEVARKAIEAQTQDERLRAELAGVMKKIDLPAKTTALPDTFSARESRQHLHDLQAELESAHDLLNLPPQGDRPHELTDQWLDRLGALPRLKRQLDQAGQSGTMGEGDLKSILEKIQKQVSGELDRRALLDAQQYLEQMSRQRDGEPGESTARGGGKREEGSLEDGARDDSENSLAGHEPGRHESGSPSLPEFKADLATQLKGPLGGAQSGGISLKGQPAAGESGIPEKEVIASYRRQAEAELDRERVPEALKETIKNYFLSLDQAGK